VGKRTKEPKVGLWVHLPAELLPFLYQQVESRNITIGDVIAGMVRRHLSGEPETGFVSMGDKYSVKYSPEKRERS